MCLLPCDGGSRQAHSRNMQSVAQEALRLTLPMYIWSQENRIRVFAGHMVPEDGLRVDSKITADMSQRAAEYSEDTASY